MELHASAVSACAAPWLLIACNARTIMAARIRHRHSSCGNTVAVQARPPCACKNEQVCSGLTPSSSMAGAFRRQGRGGALTLQVRPAATAPGCRKQPASNFCASDAHGRPLLQQAARMAPATAHRAPWARCQHANRPVCYITLLNNSNGRCSLSLAAHRAPGVRGTGAGASPENESRWQ